MSKKLILFLMVLLFGSTSFLRADEVTIGSLEGAANNSYLPMNSLYNYSYTQQIYTAEEIGMAGTINSITLWMYGTSTLPARTFDIYVKEVDKDVFANATDWVTVAATDMVYSGTVAFNNTTAEAYSFTFTTPFQYSGENNLLIAFNNLTGTWNSGLNGKVFGATGDPVMAIYARQDGSAYDPYNPTFSATATTYARNVVMIDITPGSGPTPPGPVGTISIDPSPIALGDKALNSNVWKEPLNVTIYNAGAPTVVEASLSNTSGENAFVMDTEIENVPLETGDRIEFTMNIQNGIPSGEYTEEFTLFYTGDERSILTAPVTANVYNATDPDVVELARIMSWNSGEYTDTPVDIHADYNLIGMEEKLPDVVYQFTLAKDSHFHAEAGDDFIAIYNKVTDLHLTAEVEPLVMGENGVIEDEIILQGTYYLVAASDNIADVTANFTEIPAPTEMAFIAPTPANYATNVNAPVTIKWEGGENATQYQVVFGTSPVATFDNNNWINVDENYGTFVVSQLLPTTQYFFQVFAQNSNGMVYTEKRGFTTTIVAPHDVTASETKIFTDETTLIKWKLAGQGGFEGEVTVCDGTATSTYIPVYGLWMDDFTRSEMIYPAEMLEEMEGGEITSLKYYISSAASGPWTGNVFNVYMMEVPNTTMSAFQGSANATIVYTGGLDGQGTTMTINLDTPYTYDGGNLLVGIEEVTASTWKSCGFYGIEATGASGSGYSSASVTAVPFTQRNFLPKTTFTCGDGAKGSRNFIGFNVYYGVKDDNDVYQYTKANTDLLTERQYLLGGLAYNMEGYDIKVTAVYNEGESGHSAPLNVNVKVSGYSSFNGHVYELISGAPVANAHIKFMGKDEFNNNVTFEGTTNASGYYNITGVKAGQYIGEATLEGMEPNYSEQVTLAYNVPQTVDFTIHELYKPVLSVYAEELDPSLAKVQWSINETISGGGGQGGGTPVADQTYDFDDNTMMGWTSIDGDGDGNGWVSSANPGIYHNSGVSLSGTGHNTSEAYVISGSYANQTGQALTPNNFLVSPQKAAYSAITFYACAQDASYAAEHFGVAVSTTGNTSAADFTTVQEWTMTAKGEGAMSIGRDGQIRQGNWYQYTVDLSSYAGQDIWVAIRHFNCTDMFILNVDDITLSGSRGNRSVQNYALFKAAILTEENNEFLNVEEIEDSMTYYVTTVADTLYADFTWFNDVPGLYRYGVSAHYPTPANGDRSQTSVVFDFEDGTIPSEFNNTGSYPWAVVSDNGSNVIKSSNGGVASSTSTIELTYDYPSEGTIAFDALCKGEGTSTFWDKCIFKIDGTEMFTAGANVSGWHNYSYPVSDGTHTFTWTYSKDGSVNPTGDFFEVDNITLTYESAGGDTNDDPITPITWSNILPKNMETAVTVNAYVTVGTVEGATVTITNNYENIEYTAELDETGTVVFDDFRKGEYTVTIDLEGFRSDMIEEQMSIWDTTEIVAHFTEKFLEVENMYVSGTGFANWTAVVPTPDRVAERYHVMLNGVFVGETTDNFMQLDVTGLTVGQTYNAAVAVVYTTGMSDFEYADFTLIDCATVATQVEELEGYANCMDVVLTWNGGSPTPGPGPGPGPQPGPEETYDFETGMQGWTTIDGGTPSGYGWSLGSSIMGTGYGHNGSSDLMISQSYDNNYGVVYPDNYLISPAKAAYTQIKLWACGQDASYAAEHFGVAVSTTTATASAFTMVQEWTIGSKGEKYDGPRGSRAQSTWTEYTVDLSAYAGQEIWVAVRHFNCSDMYFLDVDDITLTTASKGGNLTADNCGVSYPAQPAEAMWDVLKTFNAAEGGQYGVVTDGQYIYTSNWGYSSAANNFYKYDMDGNQIEGFNISGCGTLRGMTFDGEYIYGVANSSTVYCVDLNNHALISTFTSAYGAMRCISYDAERDGFWVVGNWSGNLTLIDRTGAIVQAGPAPTSASDVAYYKDADGVEHVYCFNNGDNGVYDYNITTNTLSSSAVFNYSSVPGFQSGASSGGCHIANYGDKLAFYGDVQQSPNLIAICELGEAQSGGGSTATSITPNKFNIFMDGEWVAATADNAYTLTVEDIDEHVYEVYFVDAAYNFSCEAYVIVAAGTIPAVTDLTAVEGYDPTYGAGAQITWTSDAEAFDIYANGQFLGTTDETEVFIYGLTAGTYTFGIVAVSGDCVSEMAEVEFVYDAVEENSIISAIYPNPTSSDLHINATAMKHISVYNAMGQMVYDQDVDGDEVILNMGQYEAGVYMVNVITENGSSVQRVTVTK